MSRILSAVLSVVLLPVFLLWLWHERRVLRSVRCDGGEGQRGGEGVGCECMENV
jgi:hypothetical protein